MIRYRIDECMDPSMAMIIAESGDAAAIYEISADGSARYSSNPSDTDECPETEDGCWPVPPAEIIERARLGIRTGGESERMIFCHGCGDEICASEAHWHNGDGYCDGCENAPAEAE